LTFNWFGHQSLLAVPPNFAIVLVPCITGHVPPVSFPSIVVSDHGLKTA
jgi:hypothetical protein